MRSAFDRVRRAVLGWTGFTGALHTSLATIEGTSRMALRASPRRCFRHPRPPTRYVFGHVGDHVTVGRRRPADAGMGQCFILLGVSDVGRRGKEAGKALGVLRLFRRRSEVASGMLRYSRRRCASVLTRMWSMLSFRAPLGSPLETISSSSATQWGRGGSARQRCGHRRRGLALNKQQAAPDGRGLLRCFTGKAGPALRPQSAWPRRVQTGGLASRMERVGCWRITCSATLAAKPWPAPT